jgi:hypothetical protein
LNPPLRSELRRISPLLGDMIDILERYGYVCNSPGRLRGVSGANHDFDIVAQRGINTILITSVSESEPEMIQMKLVSLRAMVWDCSPDIAVILLPQGASVQDAKKLVSISNFVFLERSNPATMYQGLEELLKTLGK